jgi:hypothetical protein
MSGQGFGYHDFLKTAVAAARGCFVMMHMPMDF